MMKASIIVATWNSAAYVKECLDAITSQGIGDYEIIVVDKESTDGTLSIAKSYPKTKIVTILKRGMGVARNLGLQEAKGDFIVFVDSDIIIPPSWMKILLKTLDSDSKLGGIGSPAFRAGNSHISNALNHIELEKGRYKDGLSEAPFLETIATIYRRNAIDGLRFDDHLEAGEDIDFSIKVRQRGWDLMEWHDPKSPVMHYSPESLRALVRKWYRYGKCRVLVAQKHKELRGKGLLARAVYWPLALVWIAGAPAVPWLALLGMAQLSAPFIVYTLIALKRKCNPSFIPINGCKVLAYCAGITVEKFFPQRISGR